MKAIRSMQRRAAMAALMSSAWPMGLHLKCQPAECGNVPTHKDAEHEDEVIVIPMQTRANCNEGHSISDGNPLMNT